MRWINTFNLTIFLAILAIPALVSQDINVGNEQKEDFTTSEINKNRLHWTIATSGTFYTASSIGLYQSWYKDYPLGSFHFYDDLGEWRGVDKAGHIFSAYFQSNLGYKLWSWTGLSEKDAIILGATTGFLSQTTIEIMDGFSQEWGFSLGDFGANLVGIGAFTSQQLIWGEQRILLKTSSNPINYTDRYNDPYFANRASELYGDGFTTRYLKDYNAQTTWVSFNIHSFFPESNLPKWLNVAVGYGADNMFGGYTNVTPEHIEPFEVPKRYSQFYISLDADLSKIETESPFVRTALDILNVIKAPFSTIEINTLGEVKFHLIRF